jgi:hypothetical protein
MPFNSITDLLDASAVKPKVPKPFPAHGPNGVPHIPEKLLPGEKAPAAQVWKQMSVDPFTGKKCSVRRCKEGPQWSWKIGKGGQDDLDFEQPVLTRTIASRPSWRWPLSC